MTKLTDEDRIDEEIEEDIIKDAEPEYLTDIDVITEKGIVRDEKGRFVKGTSPPGRPKRIKSIQQLIDRRTANNSMIVDKLINIALYDPDMPIAKKDEKTGKITFVKRRYHYINATTQLQALTLLLHYQVGPPERQISVEKNVNINIEKKVADITQLINQNKERLKLVK